MNQSIVVVSWRSRELLHRCLASVRAAAPDADCLVVDNASGDGTAEMVRDRFPQVRLLLQPRNLGYAGGCNRGFASGRGEEFLFLNPDVEVTRPALAVLAGTLVRRPDAGAVGGLLVDRRGIPQRRYAPRAFPTVRDLARWVLLPGEGGGTIPPGSGPREADQLAGACLLVRRRVLDEIGGFDEEFWPVWFEDVDLCLRVRQAGYRVLHHPGARFPHLGAGSIRMMDARSHYAAWYRNIQRYAGKHHGLGAARLVRALTIPGATLRLAGTFLPGGAGPFGRGPRAAAYLRVASRSLTGWPSVSQSTS
jgi:GT2 family glycosyltransferase